MVAMMMNNNNEIQFHHKKKKCHLRFDQRTERKRNETKRKRTSQTKERASEICMKKARALQMHRERTTTTAEIDRDQSQIAASNPIIHHQGARLLIEKERERKREREREKQRKREREKGRAMS